MKQNHTFLQQIADQENDINYILIYSAETWFQILQLS